MHRELIYGIGFAELVCRGTVRVEVLSKWQSKGRYKVSAAHFQKFIFNIIFPFIEVCFT